MSFAHRLVLPLRTLPVVIVGAVVAACASDPAAAPSAAAASEPTEMADISNLGQDCSFGSTPGVLASIASEECGEGYCLVDSRDGREAAAYCTADCSAKRCPSGFSCEATTGHAAAAKVCTRDPANCGDGKTQVGEACDDGNDEDGDACSADCRKVVTPLGSFAFSKFDVDGARVLSGDRQLFFVNTITSAKCGTFHAESYPFSLGSITYQNIEMVAVVCEGERRFRVSGKINKRSTEPLSAFVLEQIDVHEITDNGKAVTRWTAMDGANTVTITKATPAGQYFSDVSGSLKLSITADDGKKLVLDAGVDIQKIVDKK